MVCVKQVRNIANDSVTGPSTLIFETRFHDETLTLDPLEVPLSTDDAIDVSSELAWILSKRSLHEAKIKRLPVKLQVYRFDSQSHEKKLIGYHIFDIRSVQELPAPKFDWKPLLNPKYKGSSSSRPEILCALQVTIDDTRTPASVSPANGHPSAPQLMSDLQVKESDNVIKIWDAKETAETNCNQLFLFSIVIATVNNLDQFFSKITKEKGISSSAVSFHYTVFGKFFHTKHFYLDQPHFPVERITFKLVSNSINSIKTYFDLNPMLEITLCSKKDQSCIPLAFASLFLKPLCSNTKSEPIIGEFNLQPLDETLTIQCNTSIGVCVELESVGDHTQSNRLNTNVNGSCALKAEGQSVRSFNDALDTDDIHHYCFSIDLRSITPLDDHSFTLDSSYFLQFSYAIFGHSETIQTSKVQLAAINSAVTFNDGYFAFNFASSWNQLVTSLSNVPIIFELVQVTSPSKLIVRGLCKLYLTDIVESPADLENKKLIVKKPCILDPRDCQLASINCILCLQDLGVVTLEATSLPPLDLSVLHQHLTSPSASLSTSKEGNILQKLFIDAAIEIELWKQLEMVKFTQKLAAKNNPCSLTTDRNSIASKSATINGHMNGMKVDSNTNRFNNNHETDDLTDLSHLHEILKQRESQVNAKEAELARADKLYKERYNKLQDEILTAIEEIRGVYEEKLAKERSVISKLEEQNRKLSDEIVALKSQVKSSTLSSSLVRINSVPNSVRSASKV